MSALQARIRGADDAVALVRALVPDGDVDGMLVVGLDCEQRPCGAAVNGNHRALSFVKAWELAALTEELDACALVIGLFPSGRSRPRSQHEIDAFVDLCTRASRAQVTLLDCVVVRGHRWRSLRELSAEHSGA